jgi:DNA invertase Pin-like site-specific DNA recombinase/transposase
MSEKIKEHQLERGAYIYVRQSRPHQVRNHLESKELQYALAGRAEQLGFCKIVVIDEDLGRSGAGTQERPGFGRLLASVCQGLAGAVFALEASRLARNNRDWHHLVDLCALTETLLIDSDGVYDPRQLNDRLVLGLKGTMSEFELGLLRQRAREAFEQKVRRGFALWEVPVGFIRTEEGQIEKTPDRQVQQAITSVFQKFHQLGDMQSYHHVHVQLPRKDRQKVASMLSKGQESARVLRRASILRLLDGGQKAVQVAANIGVAPKTVRAVARRYEEEGLGSALYERHGPAAAALDAGQSQRIIAMVCGPAPLGAARWSVRMIAEEAVKRKLAPHVGRETIRIPSPEPRIETVAGKKAGASRT